MKTFTLFFSLIFSFHITAQNRANIWHFGEAHQLDFNSKPTLSKKGKHRALNMRPMASMCDEKGNLLFYSDGIEVWNHQNEVIKNGSGLKGELSNITVPYPTKTNLYFLITAGTLANPSNKHLIVGTDSATTFKDKDLAKNHLLSECKIHYSIINIAGNNGKGEIIQKNTLLYQSTVPDFCIVPHANGQDYWLITHPLPSDEFWAYLINEKGIQNTPIKSKIGQKYDIEGAFVKRINQQSYIMKANLAGDKLVFANTWDGYKIEIFDFDNKNGAVINNIPIKFRTWTWLKCLEFSPDSSKLYVAAFLSSNSTENLLQYDLTFKTTESIAKSLKALKLQNPIVSIQLAKDGKLYLSSAGNVSARGIGIIHQPNKILNECGLEIRAFGISKEDYYINNFPKCTHLLPAALILKKKAIQLGEIFTRPILFETNQSIIRPQYEAELTDIITYLLENENTNIDISGHTDNQGNADQNQQLSENRAKALADYLTYKGIKSERISYKGYGSRKPIADNATEAGKDQNRRIEFLITK